MDKYWHSVRLERESCQGCTNCLKSCPTQAIRVQGKKAKVLKDRCIDCGECIRKCPYHAKKAYTSSLSELEKFKYNVALIAPAFYGQFSKAESIDEILTAVLKLGFDDVFEVAAGAQAVSKKTKELLDSGELLKPTISSACPAVMKLIAIMFPGLIGNIIPLKSPMEISAAEARRLATEKTGLKPSEIGIFFISPCAAKMTAVYDDAENGHTEVDGVLSIKDVVLVMAQHGFGKVEEIKPLSSAGRSGVLWATTGGEAESSGAKKHIAVSGIQNVIKVLADIDDDKLSDIEFVEVLACDGGCVGGPLVMENPFVASSRIKRLCHVENDDVDLISKDAELFWDRPIIYRPVMNLDSDRMEAMKKAIRLEALYEQFPKLDCGSCGSPTCRALAEDIVRGYAVETDCVFLLRERVRELTRQMVELEGKEHRPDSDPEE
ncbi:MAG: [Fe-Fe] hydrogenase large subunit C-terminal domain-containing protein [Clostridia bacterium]|nr:[Fe-Fe] hydrogenase large subunit C-terminal domain-containing protein [Clostridia bacterium]